MQATATVPARNDKIAKIDSILKDMRQHLERALSEGACKGLIFTYDLNNGGVRRNDVKVVVEYTYVNTAL